MNRIFIFLFLLVFIPYYLQSNNLDKLFNNNFNQIKMIKYNDNIKEKIYGYKLNNDYMLFFDEYNTEEIYISKKTQNYKTIKGIKGSLINIFYNNDDYNDIILSITNNSQITDNYIIKINNSLEINKNNSIQGIPYFYNSKNCFNYNQIDLIDDNLNNNSIIKLSYGYNHDKDGKLINKLFIFRKINPNRFYDIDNFYYDESYFGHIFKNNEFWSPGGAYFTKLTYYYPENPYKNNHIELYSCDINNVTKKIKLVNLTKDDYFSITSIINSSDYKYCFIFGYYYKQDELENKKCINENFLAIIRKSDNIFKVYPIFNNHLQNKISLKTGEYYINNNKLFISNLQEDRSFISFEFSMNPLIKNHLIFNKNIEIYKSAVLNLRLRENYPNGKIIRLLNQNDRMEILEQAENVEIDGIEGCWVKVKTEKGETGWCFDGYLEEVK